MRLTKRILVCLAISIVHCALIATVDAAGPFAPAPMGVPGYAAVPGQSPTGHTTPVVAGYRAPVFVGPGVPTTVRNAAPSVPARSG